MDNATQSTNATQGKVISISGQSFAETVSYLSLYARAIKSGVRLLCRENPDLENEALAILQSALLGVSAGLDVLLHEHIRWAIEQGLVFAEDASRAGSPHRRAAGPSH